jgi:broad specificity phosphatase PhoE
MERNGDGRMAGNEDREVQLPRTERPDAPLYLARYLERRARERDLPESEPGDDGLPLYLRRFRARQAQPPTQAPPPAWADVRATEAWAETIKTKEIVPPPEARGEATVTEIHIVRHGETQGYSVDAGLTPMGSWQTHRRGYELSKGVGEGERVVIVCAPTARATQTAEHLRRGMEDGLVLWGRTAEVEGPIPIEEFRNFQVWTKDGSKDPTQAFREYHATLERYERVALGDRPLWLVEMDRFWRTQQGGGDPIHYWMTIPLLHFEPPAHVVLRFWAGFGRVLDDHPEAQRIVCATHSGPMRALATWAVGHDPGEPYNAEEVRVKLRRDRKEALVTFRNRTQEVHVPPTDERPEWWQGRMAALAAAEMGKE